MMQREKDIFGRGNKGGHVRGYFNKTGI
jgi:hypothetical protein